MKKKRDDSAFLSLKTIRIMKIALMFILVGIFQVSATTYAQEHRISVSVENGNFYDVVSQIEMQSEFMFFYKSEEIDNSQKISLNVNNKLVSEILDEITKNNNLTYKIIDKHIIITKAKISPQIYRKITGVITDENGEPIIGANIVEKGTTNGTITDIKGKFSIDIHDESVLSISYIGYLTQDIFVSGKKSLNVIMKEDTQGLDEVVVVGYGTMKKKLISGATVQVKGSDLEKQNTSDALESLQGMAAGVQITKTSGQPGAGYKVNIRGLGTIGSSTPLYVVDGIIRGSINDLDPTMIATMDVLKDAASAAIYGARAANGVILITTKKGMESKPVLTYDGYFGIQNMYKKPRLLNAQQYVEIMDEASMNTGGQPAGFNSTSVPMWDKIQSGEWTGTNWVEESLNRNAPTQRHSINVRGGNSSSTYAAGYTYFSEEGILGQPFPAKYSRSSFFINTELVLIKNEKGKSIVKIGENLRYSYVNKNAIEESANSLGDPMRLLYRALPIMENTVDKEGNYNGSMSWFAASPNPIGMNDVRGNNNTQSDGVNGNIYVMVEPVSNLIFKSDFSLNVSSSGRHSFTPAYNLSTDYISTYDVTKQSMSRSKGWALQNTLSYKTSLRKVNNFDFLLGQSLEKSGGLMSMNLNGSNVNNVFAEMRNLDFAYLANTHDIITGRTTLNGSPGTDSRIASYFSRINYDYKNRYMGTLIIRTDGSSNFASGNRWGFFPSVSAGWLISDEVFMKNTKSWLDFLKLRASWGLNGNQSISSFQYISNIVFKNAGARTLGDKKTLVVGGYPEILANPDVSWEKSDQLDIGIDARFFNSRLGVVFDWYRKITRDWLIVAPILESFGTGAPYINGGDVQNKGVELELAWNDHIKDFSYGLSFNMAFNKNEVLKIANEEGIIRGKSGNVFQRNDIYMAQVGYPIGYFYGLKTNGIFQTQEEIDNYVNQQGEKLMPNARPGDLIFVDSNGDGKVTFGDEDRTMIGNPNPDVIMGFNFNVAYKGLDISMTSTGAFGGQIFQSYRDWPVQTQDNFTVDILDRWRGPGTSSTVPKIYSVVTNNELYASDRFIKNGNYWRMTNLTVGYDFKKILKNIPLQKMRVYIAANNLFTITSYDGPDPVIGSGAEGWCTGIDQGFYPSPRTFMFGFTFVY